MADGITKALRNEVRKKKKAGSEKGRSMSRVKGVSLLAAVGTQDSATIVTMQFPLGGKNLGEAHKTDLADLGANKEDIIECGHNAQGLKNMHVLHQSP